MKQGKKQSKTASGNFKTDIAQYTFNPARKQNNIRNMIITNGCTFLYYVEKSIHKELYNIRWKLRLLNATTRLQTNLLGATCSAAE